MQRLLEKCVQDVREENRNRREKEKEKAKEKGKEGQAKENGIGNGDNIPPAALSLFRNVQHHLSSSSSASSSPPSSVLVSSFSPSLSDLSRSDRLALVEWLVSQDEILVHLLASIHPKQFKEQVGVRTNVGEGRRRGKGREREREEERKEMEEEMRKLGLREIGRREEEEEEEEEKEEEEEEEEGGGEESKMNERAAAAFEDEMMFRPQPLAARNKSAARHAIFASEFESLSDNDR